MSGERASVRLPSRIVPICVSDPTGWDLPLRTSSTPAIKVVLTAPCPEAGSPVSPSRARFWKAFPCRSFLLDDQNAIDGKTELKTRITAAEACCVPKQISNDEGRPQDLQIAAGEAIACCPLTCAKARDPRCRRPPSQEPRSRIPAGRGLSLGNSARGRCARR